MSKQVDRTTFVSRGRIAGLVRSEHPAGTGQNRTSRLANRDPGNAADEALFYRARLLLGDALPRPSR